VQEGLAFEIVLDDGQLASEISFETGKLRSMTAVTTTR
jgi:hypothetical protein